jgi:hypothetical protein
MSTNLIVRLAALSNIDVNDLTIFARRLVQSVRITDIYFNLYFFSSFYIFLRAVLSSACGLLQAVSGPHLSTVS